MSSTRRLVASNTAVQVAGRVVMLGIGLVSIAVITRYLGPDDYGRYTLALTYMQLFAVLADVGLFTIVVRDISRDPARTEELVGNTLTLRLLLSAAVVALAAAISLLLPYDPDVRTAILLAGLPLLFGMLNSTFVTVLQSRLRMGRAVVGDVLGRAELVADKSFIWAAVTEADLARYDVTLEETEGLIDFVRQAKEAEVSCVLKEVEGHVRVSLRSLGHVDVSAVAARFGGGGHRYAAGFTTTDPVPQVVETILQAL